MSHGGGVTHEWHASLVLSALEEHKLSKKFVYQFIYENAFFFFNVGLSFYFPIHAMWHNLRCHIS